ncbi:hypothetical protein O181_005405 [Austropuccinia psidii MF-1]|uniref:Uncharacterized protein n=1 Tax=Austropuccinia psidii MF-1 TaxID=1389203 RepID=A0A9Q3BIW8_9BASI|nr:hypothetical protein [Austropuccinia psidii MF-1]
MGPLPPPESWPSRFIRGFGTLWPRGHKIKLHRSPRPPFGLPLMNPKGAIELYHKPKWTLEVVRGPPITILAKLPFPTLWTILLLDIKKCHIWCYTPL